MNERYKTFLLGLFILLCCAAVIIALLFLRPSIGDEGQFIRVRFTDISGIAIGTRVTFAGRPVGEVVEIHEVPDARSQPSDHAGHAYFYELELAIDSNVKIYMSDTIAIHTNGLMGERTIGIMPHALDDTNEAQIVSNTSMLLGTSGDPFEEAAEQFTIVGQKVEEMVDKINDFIDANAPELSQTIVSIQAAADHFSVIMENAIQQNLVANVSQAASHISDLAANANIVAKEMVDSHLGDNLGMIAEHLGNVMEGLDHPEQLTQIVNNTASLTKRMNDAMPDLQVTLSNVKEISSDLATGKSTLGKLLTQDDLYNQVGVIMSRIDLLMNDINNYGILFHLSKGWQRTRQTRLSSPECSLSPQEWKRQFEVEVDQIRLTLQRVSQLMDDIKPCASPKVLQSFSDELDSLIQRLEKIETQIKIDVN